MTGAPESRLPASLQSLASGHYRKFAAGALVSGTGNWAVRLAQLLLMLKITGGSGGAAGLLAACQYLPLLVFGTQIGAVADRRSKASVLMVGQCIMASAAAIEGVLILLGEQNEVLGLALALAFGIGAAIDNTLRMSLAPELVPQRDIVNAVNLNSVSLQMGRLLGPIAAGIAIAYVGYGPVFMIATAAFLWFALVLARLGRATADTVSAPTGGASIRDGLAYVRADRELVLIFIIIGAGGLVGPNLATISTIIVGIAYGGNSAQAGFVIAVLAIGTLLGAVWTTRHPNADVRTITTAAGLLGVFAAICSLAPSAATYALMLLPTGFLALVMVTQAGALVQVRVAPSYRGRVTSLWAIVLIAGVPIGSPLYGWLTQLLGPQTALAVMGAMVCAVTGTTAAWRWVRRLRRRRDASSAQGNALA